MRTGQKRMGVALLAAAVVIVAIIVVATLGHNPPPPQTASTTPAAAPADTAAPASTTPTQTAAPSSSTQTAATPVAMPAAPPVDESNAITGGPVGGQAAWDKACEPDGNGGLLCMVSQTALRSGAADKLLRLSAGPVGPNGQMRLVLTVPLGALLPSGITVQVDQQKAFTVPMAVCLQSAGCQAVLSLDQPAYDGLKAGQQVTVRYMIADGRPVRATIMLNGLGDAVAQLAPASSIPAK